MKRSVVVEGQNAPTVWPKTRYLCSPVRLCNPGPRSGPRDQRRERLLATKAQCKWTSAKCCVDALRPPPQLGLVDDARLLSDERIELCSSRSGMKPTAGQSWTSGSLRPWSYILRSESSA